MQKWPAIEPQSHLLKQVVDRILRTLSHHEKASVAGFKLS